MIKKEQDGTAKVARSKTSLILVPSVSSVYQYFYFVKKKLSS